MRKSQKQNKKTDKPLMCLFDDIECEPARRSPQLAKLREENVIQFINVACGSCLKVRYLRWREGFKQYPKTSITL